MTPSIKTIIPLIGLLIAGNISAKDVAGVSIPDQATLVGKTLNLNGAGIRSKFVFDIYIGGLYLSQNSHDVKHILSMAGPKRVLMHVLYDEVDKEKLTGGWTAGFENNLSTQDFKALEPRLADFNKLFVDLKTGDQVLLDYLPGKGTQVTIKQQIRGTIPGEDFNRALLQVWLGHDPADADLKEAMLGNED